jgi:hypothetical protein
MMWVDSEDPGGSFTELLDPGRCRRTIAQTCLHPLGRAGPPSAPPADQGSSEGQQNENENEDEDEDPVGVDPVVADEGRVGSTTVNGTVTVFSPRRRPSGSGSE